MGIIFNDNLSPGGCGNATSAVGPFYCPADNNAYIDIQYMIRLQDQLGAERDFSQAYILAHEIGHHVQNVLGTTDGSSAQRVEWFQRGFEQQSYDKCDAF